MRKNYREEDLPPLLDAPSYTPPSAPQSPPDARSALGDPAFLSFLQQRAQALSQAQADAGQRQRWADMAGAFERGGAMIGNRPVDKDQIAALNARAQQPVTQLHQRQAGEGQAVKDYDVLQQSQERGAKASRMRSEDDPNSDLSQRARMLAVAQKLIPAGYSGPYSASMHGDMLKGATIEQAKAHAAATEMQAKASLAETKSAHDETARHHQEMEKLAGEKATKEKEIPPRQLERFAAIKSTLEELDPYVADIGKVDESTVMGTGPIGGRISAASPWKAPETSAAQGKEHALKIKLARALHGGVPTKVELEEAGEYIPTIRDTPEQRTAKVQAIKDLLSGEVETLKQTYGEGGLKTRRLTTGTEGEPAPAPKAKPAAGTDALRKKYGL